MKSNRNRSVAEKMEILQDGKDLGIAGACRKHGITASMYYRWEAKVKAGGPAGLSAKRKSADPEAKRISALEDENRRLRLLLADKMLEIEALEELKKKVQRP